jgi:hypothetical protein
VRKKHRSATDTPSFAATAEFPHRRLKGCPFACDRLTHQQQRVIKVAFKRRKEEKDPVRQKLAKGFGRKEGAHWKVYESTNFLEWKAIELGKFEAKSFRIPMLQVPSLE